MGSAPLTLPADRPTRTVTHTIRVSATRVVKRQETVFCDVTAFDQLWHAGLISDRQWQAAARLYSLYVSAGLERATIQHYRVAPEETEEEAEPALEGAQPLDGESMRDASLRTYRRLLREAGPVPAMVFERLMSGAPFYLGMTRIGPYQVALTWLADEWGMPVTGS
jgi:hypothetical protein